MTPIEVLAAIGGFIAAHPDLVIALKDAIEGGASKDALMKSIQESLVAASDAEMKRELGG